MNSKKTILLILLSLVLLSCVRTEPGYSLVQTEPEASETAEITEEETPIATYIPFLTNGKATLPSFGVEIHDFSLIEQAQQAGNHWVRYNGLLWSDLQPDSEGQPLQWTNVTEVENNLIAISEAGMETILIVRSTPEWARDHEYFCGPMDSDHIDEFASFVNKVVKRYSQAPYNVLLYEIWNEPDGPRNPGGENSPWGCWLDQTVELGGGEYYAEMLKQVYPAVKSANPKAQVVLGGLLLDCDPRKPGAPGYCPNEDWLLKHARFFEGILKNGGGDYFDYLNFHGYTTYETGMSAIQSEKEMPLTAEGEQVNFQAAGGHVEGKLDYLRELMSTYRISKPIILSEAGLLNKIEDVPSPDFQEEKAAYVLWLYSRNIARGIDATTWFTLGSGWNYSGLMQGEGLAYNAYSVMTTALDRAVYIRDLTPTSGVIGFEFQKETSRIWVLFSEDGSKKTITAPTNLLRAFDLYGAEIIPTENKITFSQPIYLEIPN